VKKDKLAHVAQKAVLIRNGDLKHLVGFSVMHFLHVVAHVLSERLVNITQLLCSAAGNGQHSTPENV